jgi:hypothetical protein
MLEPPLCRRVELVVADHDIVDACRRVVLEELREVLALAENLRHMAHDLDGKRAAKDHGAVARVVDQRAARGHGVALVVDEVEHMATLAERSPRRWNDLDSRVLQPADRLEVSAAHGAATVEERAVEVCDEEAVAHAGRVGLVLSRRAGIVDPLARWAERVSTIFPQCRQRATALHRRRFRRPMDPSSSTPAKRF